MLINFKQFVDAEKAYWEELDELLSRLDRDAAARLSLDEINRLHYLYERSSSGLVRIRPYAREKEVYSWLEGLVGRAYSEIHSERSQRIRFSPRRFFRETFPCTVRKYAAQLQLAILITLIGSIFGAGALALDSKAKAVLIPGNFSHLAGDPSDRVAKEEKDGGADVKGHEAQFSAYLMTHNIRVSMFALALGITWAMGTGVLLFYNGVILGAVCGDYLLAGEGVFLTGWLLPHGSIEIPAILLAGQGGLMLGRALIGYGDRTPMKLRLRKLMPDLCVIMIGIAVMLIWAGLIEAFFSQYHEPLLPYVVKISFGVLQLSALIYYFTFVGRKRGEEA